VDAKASKRNQQTLEPFHNTKLPGPYPHIAAVIPPVHLGTDMMSCQLAKGCTSITIGRHNESRPQGKTP